MTVPVWRILQIVVDAGTPGSEQMPQLTTGASAVVEGKSWRHLRRDRNGSCVRRKIELLGVADASYPLQKKGHTAEF